MLACAAATARPNLAGPIRFPSTQKAVCTCWIYAFAVVGPAADTLSRYLSTTSRPQSSLTTAIVAGTSIWKVRAEFAGPVQTENSFLAALMASLIAQCTEHARSSGGSPDAANKEPQDVRGASNHNSWAQIQSVFCS